MTRILSGVVLTRPDSSRTDLEEVVEIISGTNRPPISLVMDTDAAHEVVTETDPAKRKALVVDSADAKRGPMKQVFCECHTSGYVDSILARPEHAWFLAEKAAAAPAKAH